jgi:predicted Zn-dependent peptidase
MPNIFKLKNGLTVVHSERRDGLNTSLSLRFIAGSLYENTEETGIAHFLEHIVFDGTKKYPTEQVLATFIDEKGALRSGTTSKDSVEYRVKILNEEIESAFDYLSQITQFPLLSDVDIEKERKVINQECNMNLNDTSKRVWNITMSQLFPNVSLGKTITGNINEIQNISKEKIIAFMSKYYVANNAVLSVVGNISTVQVKTLSEKYFEFLLLGEKNEIKNINSSPDHDTKIEVVADLKQSTLSLGWNGFNKGTDESYAVSLISRVLTGGRSSRLFTELRGKRGMVYTVNSPHFSGRNWGYFSIRMGLSETKISEAMDVIKKELKKITNEPISSDELKKAFVQIKSNLTFSFEDSLDEAQFYSNNWCLDKIITLDEEIQNFKRVSENPTFIQGVAKRIFSSKPTVAALVSAPMDITW